MPVQPIARIKDCRLPAMVVDLGQAGERKLEHARCAPTSDDEQAVSMLTLGPLRPSVKEMRPQTALSVPLVAVYALMPCGRAQAILCK